MKRTVRVAILTLAIVSLVMVCLTTLSYAGGFGSGVNVSDNINVTNTPKGVCITWESTSEVDGYNVYRRMPEQRYPEKIARVTQDNRTSYVDASAEDGKDYEYFLRAYKGLFYSKLSAGKSIVRLSEPEIASVKSGVGCIEVEWNKIPGARKYKIYKKNNKKIELVGEVSPSDKCLFKDENITEGKKYTYTVIACNGEFVSSHSYKTSLPYVAVPEDLKIINGKTAVLLKWKKSPEADGYVVLRKMDKQDDWDELKSLKANTTSFKDSDVKNGATYIYAVKAIKNKIYSGCIDGLSTVFLKAPEKVSAKNYNDGVLINWSAINGAASYKIYRKLNDKTEFVGETSQLSYEDKTVKDGQKYLYSVKAVDGELHSTSAYSNFSRCFVIKKPLNVAVNNIFNGIQVYWEKSDYAKGYIVYRKESREDEWTAVKTIRSEKTNYFIDEKVKKDNTYIYSVRCINGDVMGSFDRNGITKRHMPSLGISAQVCPEGVKIVWNEVENCSGYELYRKTDAQNKWVKIQDFSTDVTGCIDGSPVIGVKNNYVIRVVFADGGAIDSPASYAYGIDPNKPMVALTYDDGPSGDVTPRILNRLKEYNARATFFVVGQRVANNENLLRMAVAQDCEIGNHSFSHKDLSISTKAEINEEINSTNNEIKRATGKAPVVARAPGGAMDELVKATVKMPFIFWSIDTLDWKHRNADMVINSVKGEVGDGSIILMHDLYESTAGASDVLIPWLKENGYQMVTVSEMMAVKGIDMKNGEVYVRG